MELKYNPARTPVERLRLAENHNTHPHILTTLYNPEVENRTIDAPLRSDINIDSILGRIYTALACNPTTPEEVALKLLTNGNGIVELLTKNTTIPEILRKASTMGRTTARNLAANPYTPPDILENLINLNSVTINRSIAQNPNTPTKILARLLPFSYYREQAEENLKTRPEFENYPIEWIEQIIKEQPDNETP